MFATRFAACTGDIRIPFMNWYKIVCMGDLLYEFIWTKFTNFLSTDVQTQVRSLKSHCSFDTEPYCSDFCGYQRSPHNLAEIYRNMSICGGFRAMAARENYPGFILIWTNCIMSWEVVKRDIWIPGTPFATHIGGQCANQGPLLLTWFNFNPSMAK